MLGLVLFVLGLAGLVFALLRWKTVGYGSLNPVTELKIVIPSAAVLTIGLQGALASAFLSVLEIRPRTVAGKAFERPSAEQLV